MAHDNSVEDHDEEAPGAPIAIADSGDSGEGGKLRMIVGLLKKALGVKDIAAMRLSLPASLLEPIPNLEYWQYLDRPDLFAGINESEEPFERLLALLRFIFSKDIKFIHGKICKPYNSVLGEFFLAHWDVVPPVYPSDDRTQPPIQHLYLLNPKPPSEDYTPGSSTPSLAVPKSSGAIKSRTNLLKSGGTNGTDKFCAPSPTLSAIEQNLAAGISDLSLVAPSERSLLEGSSIRSSEVGSTNIPERVRISFLTEQISHHPPISAYHYSCPSRGICASGVDQISARVSGTSVKVGPGTMNQGIFVNIEEGCGKGERYKITHPTATVNGMLTGKLYASVSDSTIVTINGGEPWRVIIEYKDESWLGSAKFLIEGCVHTVDEDSDAHEGWTKVKHVPPSKIIARLEGCWHSAVRFKRCNPSNNTNSKQAGGEDWKQLIDLSNLAAVPKAVRPLTEQLPNESRRLWEGVTNHLLKKEYSDATRIKQTIEQRQRDLAAAMKKKGENFVPVYFESDISTGEPHLTEKGREMLEREAEAATTPQ